MQNLKNIYNIFEEIKNTSSTNDKKKIIEKHKDNQLFIECIKFLLDDMVVTGLNKAKINKKIKNTTKQDVSSDISLALEYIKNNNSGRDENILWVQSFIAQLEDVNLKCFMSEILTKSYKLGVKAKLVNAVIPNLIPEFNVMLAESYSKNQKRVEGKDFILSLKLDGNRMIMIKNDNGIKFYTRQGKEVTDLIEIENVAKTLPNGVYDGEVLALDGYNNSKEQFTQTMKRVRIKGVKKGLKFVCFDYIENEKDFFSGIDTTSCIDRKKKLEEILSNVESKFIENLPILYVGKDISTISHWSKWANDNGEEGIMLNIADAPYSCKRTKDLLKIKTFFDADVKVINIIEGDGKYKNSLGAITIQFEHEGSYWECNCGSGFSDSEREFYWNNKELLLNKIVTIGYFEISSNDNGGYGLRFSTWKGIIRDDKDEISMY